MAKPGFYNHWKFKMLCSELKQVRPKVLGHVQMIWDVSGIIGKISYTADELEAVAEWDGEPGELVRALCKVRLVDYDDEKYVIHDWWDHCPYYVKKKIKSTTGVESREKEININRDKKELTETTDIWGVEKEEMIQIINGLNGSIDVKDYELLVNRTVMKYWDNEEMNWLIRDTLKRIKDARFYGKEKDVGEIKNERAFFFSVIKNNKQ